MTLQNHRANNRAAFVDLTTSGPEPKPATTYPTEGEIIPSSPPIKQESPPKPEVTPTPTQASTKPPATAQTYKWSPVPTASTNTHIHDDSFLKTISTEYPAATPNVTLTCMYDTNPQATLTAALHILGTTLPADVLQTMFQYDLTKSGKTLPAFLKEHNAGKHFQFDD
jgi:hypothetical protein